MRSVRHNPCVRNNEPLPCDKDWITMHSGLQRDQYVRVLQSRARAKCERPLGFASCSVRDSQVRLCLRPGHCCLSTSLSHH